MRHSASRSKIQTWITGISRHSRVKQSRLWIRQILWWSSQLIVFLRNTSLQSAQHRHQTGPTITDHSWVLYRVPMWSLFPGKVLTFDHRSLGPGNVLSFSNFSKWYWKNPYILIKSRLMNRCLMPNILSLLPAAHTKIHALQIFLKILKKSN